MIMEMGRDRRVKVKKERRNWEKRSRIVIFKFKTET